MKKKTDRLLESFVQEAAEEQRYSFIEATERAFKRAIDNWDYFRVLSMANEIYEKINSGESGDPRLVVLLKKMFEWYVKTREDEPNVLVSWTKQVTGVKNVRSVVELLSGMEVDDHRNSQLSELVKKFPAVGADVLLFLLGDQHRALELLYRLRKEGVFAELIVGFVQKFLGVKQHDLLACVVVREVVTWFAKSATKISVSENGSEAAFSIESFSLSNAPLITDNVMEKLAGMYELVESHVESGVWTVKFSVAGGPDWRPDYTVPEDYYAL